MNVLLTFDVEIWCDGWSDLDGSFPKAFSRYVYGRSSRGDCALPLTLRILNEHGLRGTFFVEPLFACRFGLDRLREIVDLVVSAGQDVQLHLHPEWADEARPPLLGGVSSKRPDLSQYSFEEQMTLIARGKELLERAGAPPCRAFRAGNYGCNRDTLKALSQNGISFDTSVNASRASSAPDLARIERSQRIARLEGIVEYPVSVFLDRPRHLRPVQVGSVSLLEMKHLLRQAYEQSRAAFVIVSHNFEMLVPGSTRCDRLVVRRFVGLCDYLARHARAWPTKTFCDLEPIDDPRDPPPLTSAMWRTTLRAFEQAWRRLA